MKTHQHTPDPYLLRTPPVLTEIVTSNANPSRAEPGMCARGYCFLDPARPCADRCKYLQAERVLREEKAREGIDDDDPLAPARGLSVGLALSVLIVIAVVLLSTGGVHLWRLVQSTFFSH